MLLNKVLSQIRSGASMSIQEIADRLFADTDTIKHAVTLLCRLEYCEQIIPYSHVSDCKHCCAGSCSSPSDHGTYYWRLTHKGIGYLERLPE